MIYQQSWIHVNGKEIEGTCKTEDHSNLLNNMNGDLSKLKSYFDINRLSINVTKCEYMQIGTYQSLALIAKMPNLMFYINNAPLKKYQSLSIWECTLMRILNGMNI